MWQLSYGTDVGECAPYTPYTPYTPYAGYTAGEVKLPSNPPEPAYWMFALAGFITLSLCDSCKS